MRAFPAALERLTEQFARLPGIGMKSAQRLAFYVLSLPKEDADSFAQAIVDAKNSVRLCPVCQNLTDQELCGVCADPERDHSLICVVAEPKDVIAMERAREYHGVYHVLHGVISPLNHVGPDDLKIRELLARHPQINVQYRVADDYTILNMVESRLGVSILPEAVLRRSGQRLTARRLSPELQRTIGVIYKQKTGLSTAGQLFLSELKASRPAPHG